jgi:hypothetical protein
MSKKNRGEKIRGQFTPIFHETTRSPAWKQLSFGARALFIAVRMRCINNNGHVHLCQREAGKELGHLKRNDIANWFRELQHFGFIVQTEAASLGVNGRGKAPHWRITDLPTRGENGALDLATKDFLKWDGVLFEPHVAPSRRWSARKAAALKKNNPGLHVGTTVDSTSVPGVDYTSVPLGAEVGSYVQPISGPRGGTDVQPISSIATGVAGGILEKEMELCL